MIDDISLAKELNLSQSDTNTKPKNFYSFITFLINSYLLTRESLLEEKIESLKTSIKEKEKLSR